MGESTSIGAPPSAEGAGPALGPSPSSVGPTMLWPSSALTTAPSTCSSPSAQPASSLFSDGAGGSIAWIAIDVVSGVREKRGKQNREIKEGGVSENVPSFPLLPL